MSKLFTVSVTGIAYHAASVTLAASHCCTRPHLFDQGLLNLAPVQDFGAVLGPAGPLCLTAHQQIGELPFVLLLEVAQLGGNRCLKLRHAAAPPGIKVLALLRMHSTLDFDIPKKYIFCFKSQ